MNKQKWFFWHSLAGIKLSILICFILITGTLAVLSHELDWLANPSIRVIPTVDSAKINWSQIYLSTGAQGNSDVIESIRAPIDNWFAVEVIRLDNEGQRYREFYHPITGQYQGDGRWYNWQRFFRMTHRHFMMPTIIGTSIVCIVGLVMFLSLVSGFFLIPKWWQKFFRKPRANNRKVFWNDCHRLFGLWSSWLLFVVCLTGIWYLVELWGGRASFPEQREYVNQQEDSQAIMPVQRTFEHIMNSVENYHDMKIKQILLPGEDRTSVIIQGENDTSLVRIRANNVIFNPHSGEYISSRFAQEQSFHVRISEAADPLHFGTFYGIYSKIIYFIFGVVLSSLAISGTYLYGLRHNKLYRKEQGQVLTTWRASINGMGIGKWLSIVLISISIILTLLLFGQFVLV